MRQFASPSLYILALLAAQANGDDSASGFADTSLSSGVSSLVVPTTASDVPDSATATILGTAEGSYAAVTPTPPDYPAGNMLSQLVSLISVVSRLAAGQSSSTSASADSAMLTVPPQPPSSFITLANTTSIDVGRGGAGTSYSPTDSDDSNTQTDGVNSYPQTDDGDTYPRTDDGDTYPQTDDGGTYPQTVGDATPTTDATCTIITICPYQDDNSEDSDNSSFQTSTSTLAFSAMKRDPVPRSGSTGLSHSSRKLAQVSAAYPNHHGTKYRKLGPHATVAPVVPEWHPEPGDRSLEPRAAEPEPITATIKITTTTTKTKSIHRVPGSEPHFPHNSHQNQRTWTGPGPDPFVHPHPHSHSHRSHTIHEALHDADPSHGGGPHKRDPGPEAFVNPKYDPKASSPGKNGGGKAPSNLLTGASKKASATWAETPTLTLWKWIKPKSTGTHTGTGSMDGEVICDDVYCYYY